MGSRKGWRRLAIALGVPYFGFWAFFGIANYIDYERVSLDYAKYPAGVYNAMEVAEGRILTDENWNISMAVLFGVVVPILALVVWLIARWVYRGFKLDRATET